MKESKTLVRKLCEEFGLDTNTQLRKLRASVFRQFMNGDDPRSATIEMDVVRMWLASMVSREQVRPEMRKTFDELRQVGTYELREAWEVSELPFEKFNNLLVHYVQDPVARPPDELLH
jgi:hypothetical protein